MKMLTLLLSPVPPPPEYFDLKEKIPEFKKKPFKPYTLEQYKKLKDIPIVSSAKLGP